MDAPGLADQQELTCNLPATFTCNLPATYLQLLPATYLQLTCNFYLQLTCNFLPATYLQLTCNCIQSYSITGASSSDCLGSYPGRLSRESYPLCRDAVSVFCSPSWPGLFCWYLSQIGGDWGICSRMWTQLPEFKSSTKLFAFRTVEMNRGKSINLATSLGDGKLNSNQLWFWRWMMAIPAQVTICELCLNDQKPGKEISGITKYQISDKKTQICN